MTRQRCRSTPLRYRTARLHVLGRTPMRLNTRAVRVAAAAACIAVSLAACTSPGDDTAETSSSSSAGSSAAGPDVNGDGKVIVGVLSPGDLNDNGYYESFVAKAEEFTKSKGW